MMMAKREIKKEKTIFELCKDKYQNLSDDDLKKLLKKLLNILHEHMEEAMKKARAKQTTQELDKIISFMTARKEKYSFRTSSEKASRRFLLDDICDLYSWLKMQNIPFEE
jgi:hypothetical protein